MVKNISVSPKDFSSAWRYRPALFLTENWNEPATDLSLLSFAIFLTTRVPTSFSYLLTSSAVTDSFFSTSASTSGILLDINVYPVTAMELASSVTVYTPTGRLLNSAVEPAATVKKYTSVSKVFLSDCRYNPALFFTENLKNPDTFSLLSSFAVLLTVRLPTSCSNLFSNVTVELAVVTLDTVPVPLVVLSSTKYV